MIEPGDLLIAPPTMPDPRFAGTVLLVSSHDRSGSVAFAVNRETDYTVNDILDEVGIEANLPFPLYSGGPVRTTGVWLLHDPDWYTENTMLINDEWSITSSLSMFHHFADGDMPRQFRFVHGMAKWGPQQLNMEMSGDFPWASESSWLSLKGCDTEWVYDQPLETLWETATQQAGRQAVREWL